MPAPITDEQLKTLREAIFSGRKIEAIRTYREITSLGLKESKEAIEDMERDLRTRHPDQFKAAPAGKGCTTTAAVFLVVGVGLAALIWRGLA